MTKEPYNLCFWESNPPDFVNEKGIKWWLHKDLTREAKRPNMNDTTLDYQVFVVELPNGSRTVIILDEKRNPIFETQDTCEMWDKIQIMKLIKDGSV